MDSKTATQTPFQLHLAPLALIQRESLWVKRGLIQVSLECSCICPPTHALTSSLLSHKLLDSTTLQSRVTLPPSKQLFATSQEHMIIEWSLNPLGRPTLTFMWTRTLPASTNLTLTQALAPLSLTWDISLCSVADPWSDSPKGCKKFVSALQRLNNLPSCMLSAAWFYFAVSSVSLSKPWTSTTPTSAQPSELMLLPTMSLLWLTRLGVLLLLRPIYEWDHIWDS